MSIYYGPLCTCGKPWHSVLPPPACPVHANSAAIVGPGWGFHPLCAGRHCAHDSRCFGTVANTYTATWRFE